MRIALIAGNYPPTTLGGGEISTQYLAEALQKAGDDISVLTCAATPSVALANDVEVTRIRSPNIYWRNETGAHDPGRLAWHILENWNPKSTQAISHFLRARRFDLVLTSTIENFGAGAWLAAAACGVPSVHILRSYYPLCWRGALFKDGRNCARRCIDCRALSKGRMDASQRVNGVVGISRHVLDAHLDAGAFRAATPVILPDPAPEARMTRTAKQNAPAGRFGYLGVLSPNKGLETLAAAWRAADLSCARLFIGGAGAAAYERNIRGLFADSATFSGWVNAEDFLDGLDFLIVPSIWREPFGRIVVEAYSRAVPVIASRAGGIPEMVDDQQTGFLFDPGDADGLAHAIRRARALSAGDYRAMSQAALAKAAGFASKPLAKRYQDYFAGIVAAAHPAHVL